MAPPSRSWTDRVTSLGQRMTGRHTSWSFHDFLTVTRWEDMPVAVMRMAERCLLDLVGTAVAGTQTELSRIIGDHATRFLGAGPGESSARLMLDGRRASPLGAALAGGTTIDSFDAHDGHVLTKGHAGCAILPGLAAVCESRDRPTTGADFLASLVIGYEVAIRAGMSLHRISPEYHASGAWNALGVAAVAARLLQMDAGATREALGIAEYHGPRSPMMRCIDSPTMVKDGSGWGAMAGLSAAYLASEGFTGAPALIVEDPDVADLWSDLGERWRILELYFKPHPTCRWAQPALEAALAVRRDHALSLETIESIEIESFNNAVRLDQRTPRTTEEAQYSLPFAVAVAVAHGDVRPSSVLEDALRDPLVLSISGRVTILEAADIESRYPATRLARARFRLSDGRVLESQTTAARGDAEEPLSDVEIEEKFLSVAVELCGRDRASEIVEGVGALADQESIAPLLDLLSAPPARSPSGVRAVDGA